MQSIFRNADQEELGNFSHFTQNEMKLRGTSKERGREREKHTSTQLVNKNN